MKQTHLTELISQLSDSPESVQLFAEQKDLIELIPIFLTKKIPNKKVILLSKDEKSMRQIFDTLTPHLKPDSNTIHFLPSLSHWGSDRYVHSYHSKMQRLSALAALRREEACLIITTKLALSQLTCDPQRFEQFKIELKVDQDMDDEALLVKLQKLGYLEVDEVKEEGTFAVRGSIVDIYSPQNPQPTRVEVFDEKISSIRFFSSDQQRSTKSTKFTEIIPTREFLVDYDSEEPKIFSQKIHDYLQQKGQHDSSKIVHAMLEQKHRVEHDLLASQYYPQKSFGWEYLDQNTLLFYFHPKEICQQLFEEELHNLTLNYQDDLNTDRISMDPTLHFEDKSADFPFVETNNPHQSSGADVHTIPHTGRYPKAEVISPDDPLSTEKWSNVIKNASIEQVSVYLVCPNKVCTEQAKETLVRRDIDCSFDSKFFDDVFEQPDKNRDTVKIIFGLIEKPLFNQRSNQLFIPWSRFIGRPHKRKASGSKKLKQFLKSFKDLKPGDLVVHIKHGIGRYLGMKFIEKEGCESDFLMIEYANQDKVYLPIDKLNILQKYSSDTGESNQRLDKLGGTKWIARKQSAKKKILEIAKQLVEQQAKRKLATFYAYSEPEPSYYKFEDQFPFAETEDQLKALEDIESDLKSGQPMDRLICGDVGFGKTEVAMRAAFRAVEEGFQVIVLVPTTILCFQHYQTFRDRMKKFGVEVQQVNRFVPNKKILQTLEDFTNGGVDILVGTHRVLSKDIKAKKLGLIVVDEEQRFGVTHKEKLKSLRAQVDILTLSATPIPRTLHMTMIGLRDISIIATPPQNRTSIKTLIAAMDESLVRNYIQREVDRGGQVFFLHNRVQDIEEFAAFVRSLVPGVEIRTGHGQMSAKQLEDVMIDFIQQKFSVLVCTTIIESGIDIPNVNTIIVNRADRFGLSQLYQLRGRVGRSDRQAHALFLTPPIETLSDDGRKRLEILATHQSLGAGFEIASSDLEIRGAGNLLGSQQSGQIREVGFELYTQMLDQAIRDLQSGDQKPIEEIHEISVKVKVSANIPRSYIKSESKRLEIYKDLFSRSSEEEIDQYRHTIHDQFGTIPNPTLHLIELAKLKFLLRQIKAQELNYQKGSRFKLKFTKLEAIEIDRLIALTASNQIKWQLTPDFCLLGKLPRIPVNDRELLGMLNDQMRVIIDALSDTKKINKKS